MNMSEWKTCPRCQCCNLNREKCEECRRTLADVEADKPKSELAPVGDLLPQVAGRMECSNQEFERRCRLYLAQEQEKPLPDNGLISVLCDGVRLAREYSKAMNL